MKTEDETPVAEAPVTPVDADELPVKVDADFAQLPEAASDGPAERDPHDEDSRQAQEAFELAAATKDEDRAVRHYLKAANLAEGAREWYLAAVSCQRVGEFLLNDRPPTDSERAFRMYRRAVAAYEQCGLFEEARRLQYRLMTIKLKRAGAMKLSRLARLELLTYWAFAGFGFRPLRIVGATLVIISAYGLLFWATDGVVSSGASPRPASFWECLYFSGITFSTVGYGDFLPVEHMRFAALTEGALGVFTIGFFVVVLANRLRH